MVSRGRPKLGKPTMTFSIRVDQEVYDILKMRKSDVRKLLEDFAKKNQSLAL
jgi:hypothetical protein